MFNLTVEENVKYRIVYIYGINIRYLIRDIERIWGTTVISKYIFYNVKSNSCQVYSFFIPDLYFTLSKLLEYNDKWTKYSKTSQIRLLMQLLKTETWYRDYFKPIEHTLDYSQLKNLTYTLLPIQKEALAAYDEKVLALHLKGYLLAADVGSGKSIMSLAIAACLHSDPIIIIAPKSILTSVWVDAIITQFRGSKTYWASNSSEPLVKGLDVYIFHFEALDKAITFFTNYKISKPTIILDESHNLNDITAIRTKQYLEVCKVTNSQNILHTSGTAFRNLATETIPLFRAIDDMFTDKVEIAFKSIYKKSGTRAVEILANRLGMVSHKISKDSIMGDTKPIRKLLPVKLPNAERYEIEYVRNELATFTAERKKFYAPSLPHHEEVYLKCIAIYEKTIRSATDKEAFATYQGYISTMRKGYNNMTMGPLSQYCNNFEKTKIIPTLPAGLRKEFNASKAIYKYLDLVIMGQFLGGVLGRRRAELHSELIEHSGIDTIVNNAEKKTICFTNYVDTLRTAKEYFESRGFQPIAVFAETNKDVHSILEEFKTNPVVNPLITTIKSLSTGVTLIVANVVIFLNPPWRSIDYEQAGARVFRLGQTAQVYFYDIVLDTGDIPNISNRMSDIMNMSADNVEAIMGKSFDGYTLEDISIDNLFDEEKAIVRSVFDF